MRTSIFQTLSVLALLLCTLTGFSQATYQIKGSILDQQGQGVAYCDVIVQNSQILTTDNKGEFKSSQSFALPISVQITAMGYKTKYVVLDQKDISKLDNLRITLEQDQTQLEEVLVTIRRDNSYLTNSAVLGGKFSGTIKDIPQSISLVSAELMEDKQAFQLTDVISDLAGVTQASSYDEFVIRGFKSGYDTGYRLINGMRSAYGFGESYYRSPMILNLESIEVLKGPTASLFGDIAPGGTINMITKKPLDEFKGNIQLAAGSFQTLRTTLDLGGPLEKNKKMLYRLNTGYETSQTFRDINNRTNFLFAPSFLLKPVEGTDISIDLVFDNFKGYLDRGMSILGGDLYALPRSFSLSQPSDFFNTTTITASIGLKQKITPNLVWNTNYTQSSYKEDLNEHRTLNSFANPPENTIVNLRFFDRHGKEYTSNVVSYVKWDIYEDNIQNHLVVGVDYAQYNVDKNSYQREARSKMVDGKIVPLTYDLNKPSYGAVNLNDYIWRPNTQYPFMSPYHTTGVYFQDQLNLFERFKMVVGLRYENHRSKSTDITKDYTATQNVLLPRVGLTYVISPSINYFASYSQGYVPVSADFIVNHKAYGSDKPFKSESSYQIETGVKAAFLKDQLQVDLSLFHIERDQMLMQTGIVGPEGLPYYRQAGKVSSQGVEVDIRGQFTKELQIMANYTYNKTKIKNSSDPSEDSQLLAGAPKNSASLWVKYVLSHSALKGLGVGAGVYYVDKRRLNDSFEKDAQGQTVWGYLPSYTTANAAVYYHIDKVKVAVNVNNIFDKYYFLGGFDYTRVFAGAPRNIMGSISFTF
ncbi:TonB-dependent siderophore receptor [Myroides sp. LJL116]